jgi:hypothetical protein
MFYAAGQETPEGIVLRSLDEYALDSGCYYSADLFMCNRYTYFEAEEAIKDSEDSMYMVTITKTKEGETKTEVEEM